MHEGYRDKVFRELREAKRTSVTLGAPDAADGKVAESTGTTDVASATDPAAAAAANTKTTGKPAAVAPETAKAASEAVAKAASEAVAKAAVEQAAATKAELDALEDSVRRGESLCAQRAATEANEWALRRARSSVPWFLPRLDCATGFLWASFATVFIAASALYFVFHDRISESPYVYVGLYWLLFGTVFAVVAFYVLMQAAASGYDTQRAISSDKLEQTAVAFLLSSWPLTDALIKTLYPNDTLLRDVEVPAALLPLDPNRVLFADIIACNLLIEVINLTVILQPLQPPGRLTLWRQWFAGSALLRQAWVYRRAYVDDAAALFIDQNLFPNSARPAPSLYARLTRNPVRLIEVAVALVSVAALAAYVWWAAALARGSLRENMELFATVFGQFYLSAALIAIVFENAIRAADVGFNYEEGVDTATNDGLIAGYPDAVPAFKSLNPCNALVDQLQIPPETDPNAARVVAFAGMRGFFQTISTSLKLASPPPNYKVRLWRSEFKSCYARAEWPAARPTLVGDRARFINDKLYLKAHCETFYMPPEYFGRGWLCRRRQGR